MNKNLNPIQLDNYEAEIVEDIPEQFDLSRYKKNNSSSNNSNNKNMATLQYNRGASSGALSSSANNSGSATNPGILNQTSMQSAYGVNPLMSSYAYPPVNQNMQVQGLNSALDGAYNIYQNYNYHTLQLNRQNQNNKLDQHIPGSNSQQQPSQQQQPQQQQQQQYIQFNPTSNYNYNGQPIIGNGAIIPSQNPSNFQRQYLNTNANVDAYGNPIQPNQAILSSQQQYYDPLQPQLMPPSNPNMSTLKKKSSSTPKYLPTDYKSQDLIVDPHHHYVHHRDYEQDHPKPLTKPYLSNAPSSISSSSSSRHAMVSSSNYPSKSSTAASSNSSKSSDTGRKKNSFEDEENDSPYQKKEYYLKGGEDLDNSKKGWLLNRENVIDDRQPSNYKSVPSDLNNSSSSVTGTPTTQPKSALKNSNRKPGVTFEEKLQVYEVNNPHYGTEVKIEKREMKKKKKDKQKEEEIIFKTQTEMKAKIQNQNMIPYYFYEKTLLYNALGYYEETFYKSFIERVFQKMQNFQARNDDKLRNELLQMIEKDNQLTIDIIKYVKKDFLSKLEPYCNQYQCTVDKLQAIPGMSQVICDVANSINYAEIINWYVNKESNGSPSGLRKILGHEPRIEKFLNNYQSLQIKPPVQIKNQTLLPKPVSTAIDWHVFELHDKEFKKPIEFKTLTELVFKLSEICENDVQTVRAIYKYIVHTRLNTITISPTGMLLMNSVGANIESANTIFSRLCSFAGIESRLVKGMWKNIQHEPGDKCDNNKCVWNAVYLDGGWRFVQPALSPIKYYSRSQTGLEETEFYFLIDPELLLWEFFPSDKVWQFTDTTITSKEFEKRPIITPYFRTLNLEISYITSTNIDKEPFKLCIRYPSEFADQINFKYSLMPIGSKNNILSSDAENNPNNYVIAEIIADENTAVFKITTLPGASRLNAIGYNFTVFASLIDDSVPAINPNALPMNTPIFNDDAKAVISMKLTSSKMADFEIPPNRINEISVFGTSVMMKRLGLVCCDFKQGILGTDRDGKLNLVFEMSQPLDVEAYLYASDPSIGTKCLELSILKRVVSNFLIIIINPPHPGLYGLDLHGAPRGTSTSFLHSQLPPIGKYLIKCHRQERTVYQFPKGDNRCWGPKQRFYDLGLHTVGNMDPYIVNEDGKQIEIEIATLKSVTMWYKFDWDHNGTPKGLDNYCFMNYKNSSGKKDKTISFLLRFPQRGFYHLALMANDEVFPDTPSEIVYNYLIRVQDPSADVESFPIISNPALWKDCCLIAPRNFRLNSYDVHFSIIVPNAKKVQITNQQQPGPDGRVPERTLGELEPREIENSWVGLISVDHKSRSVYIEAQFNNRSHENKFVKLIKFKGLSNSFRD